MTAFGPLLRFDAQHDYYGDANPPVEIVLDGDTRTIAAQCDLQVKAKSGSLELYAPQDLSNLRDMRGVGAVPIVFAVYSSDPNLATVTEGLSDGVKKMLVLDDDPALLGDTTISKEKWWPLSQGSLIKPADMLRAPLAIVRISLPFDQKDARRRLRFAAVAQHWIYHVTGGAEAAEYSVRDPDNAINFDALEPRALANGRLAKRFRSATPIPVLSRPTARFELLGDGPFGKRVVLPVLPAATAGSSSLDPAGSGLSSDIDVNVT